MSHSDRHMHLNWLNGRHQAVYHNPPPRLSLPTPETNRLRRFEKKNPQRQRIYCIDTYPTLSPLMQIICFITVEVGNEVAADESDILNSSDRLQMDLS